jgi:hypothetical protein
MITLIVDVRLLPFLSTQLNRIALVILESFEGRSVLAASIDPLVLPTYKATVLELSVPRMCL